MPCVVQHTRNGVLGRLHQLDFRSRNAYSTIKSILSLIHSGITEPYVSCFSSIAYYFSVIRVVHLKYDFKFNMHHIESLVNINRRKKGYASANRHTCFLLNQIRKKKIEKWKAIYNATSVSRLVIMQDIELILTIKHSATTRT